MAFQNAVPRLSGGTAWAWRIAGIGGCILL